MAHFTKAFTGAALDEHGVTHAMRAYGDEDNIHRIKYILTACATLSFTTADYSHKGPVTCIACTLISNSARVHGWTEYQT